MKYDFVIIGAGIVGLSTAWQLQARPGAGRVLLLEKEPAPARHQSGHNSGVIHAGVYYRPGSLKARFCRQGASDTYAFCERYGVPCERTGKLLVASSDTELERMQALFEQCRENGLRPRWTGTRELQELEPAISARGAFLVSESGIVDFPGMCSRMLQLFRENGGTVQFNTEVTQIEENDSGVQVRAGRESFSADRLVVCGGLMADRLAHLQGLDSGFRIIPYRGEYYRLRKPLGGLVRHLVYPIPDPALPFLGIHLTPMVDGTVTVGPNAVQAWKREGYGRINFSLRDTLDMMAFPGFWKVTARHWRHGIRETRNSLFKSFYLKAVRRYCPGLGPADLEPYPAGIRAQAVLADGTMIHDFLIEQTPRSLHVCNAPSPAATSSIPIGSHICAILLGDDIVN